MNLMKGNLSVYVLEIQNIYFQQLFSKKLKSYKKTFKIEILHTILFSSWYNDTEFEPQYQVLQSLYLCNLMREIVDISNLDYLVEQNS